MERTPITCAALATLEHLLWSEHLSDVGRDHAEEVLREAASRAVAADRRMNGTQPLGPAVTAELRRLLASPPDGDRLQGLEP